MVLREESIAVGRALTRAVFFFTVVLSLTSCGLIHRNASMEEPPQKPKLPAPVMAQTPEVAAHIWNFMRKDPKFIPQAIARKKQHTGQLERIFEHEGVPVELLNVAMIESGFRTDARSQAGAVGLWQFIKPTAVSLGLVVNTFLDQRKDPILSTIAAAKYLKSLYLAYHDWNLALAAYNAGPGTIDRAIKETGSSNFWDLARTGWLSRETSDYVPRFIAVNLIQVGVRVRPIAKPPLMAKSFLLGR